jgi:hypothetical protein
MTEAEWLTSTKPYDLLDFMGNSISARKIRLFACACCRRIWDFLEEEWMRNTVTLMELFADHEISEIHFEEIAQKARRKVEEPRYRVAPQSKYASAVFAVYLATRLDPVAVRWAYRHAAGVYRDLVAEGAEQEKQCRLLRDITGSPFRSVRVAPSWCTSTVTTLAEGIYSDHLFADLPILADALNDAGCIDEAILGHCRSGGEHVRGCWVVDLILGKK